MQVGLMAMAAVALMAVGVLAAAPAANATGGAGGVSVPGPGNAGNGGRVKLWEKAPGMVETGDDKEADPKEPTMDIFLPAEGKGTGQGMLILPGGGYTNLAMPKEGADIARVFVEKGVACFVVRYRHTPRYRGEIPLMDGQRAVRMVRSRAAEWKVDPKKIGVLGFSAGGHLAACLATMAENGPKAEKPDAIDGASARVDFVVLMYPVITFTDESVMYKAGRNVLAQQDKALAEKLSPELHVTKDAPPAFLVATTTDRTVLVMNSVMYYEACLKAKVPAEMHIFGAGAHGFGLAANDPVLSTWPEMAGKWLERLK